MSVKPMRIGDIQGARVSDGIGWVIRRPDVGRIEAAAFRLNVQPPHLILFPTIVIHIMDTYIYR